jgi:Ca-activated chloride channel family protein
MGGAPERRASDCPAEGGMCYLSLLSLLICGLNCAPEVQPAQAVRIQTTLVQVPVIVTDEQERYVPDLKASEFSLYEDGVSQSIAVFNTSRDPIHIAVLLDTSRSTATVIDKIRKAASAFLSHLRAQDQAMVMSFDSEVRVLSRLKSDRQLLQEGVRKAEVAAYPDTRLRDAVYDAVQTHLVPFQGRKCILLLSDGQDVGSRVSVAELMDAVFGSDTVIYPIYYRVDPRELMKKLFGVTTRAPYDQDSKGGPNKNYREYEAQGEEFLRKLAEESAGRLFASDVDKLDRAFEQITRELSHQYMLGFYPSEASIDGRLHLLTVKVSRPGVSVRARRSYRTSPP